MTQDVLTTRLRNAALFQGLTPFQITEIARHAERVMYRPGNIVTVRGEISDKAILIIEGELDCLDGIGASTEQIGNQAGNVLSEMAMFIDNFEHAATFRARSLTKALLISRRAMLRQMATDPAMAEQLVAKVSARLSSIVNELRTIEASLGPPRTMPPTPADVPSARARSASAARLGPGR